MNIYEILFEDGVEPEAHEMQTALFLSKNGKRVTFLAPQNKPGVKTPDILIDDIAWEIKSPVSAGARSIEHAFRGAIRQSENVLFDLRRSKASDQANLSKINRQIRRIRGKELKRVAVITKEQKMLDLK